MDWTKLSEALKTRRSRRQYRGRYLNNHQIANLERLIAKYTAEGGGGFRMELAADSGAAFSGFTRSYGMLSGVNNFVGLVCGKGDWLGMEKLGYFGELLVLEAVSMGLGTCWVSFAAKKVEELPFTLKDGEKIASAIVIGNVNEQTTSKERFVRGLLNIRQKTLEELYISDVDPPQWFIDGVMAAQKAPSAMKKQPVHFRLKDGKVTAGVNDITEYMNAYDLGIFKLHFQIGAGGGQWEWGNHGVYTPK